MRSPQFEYSIVIRLLILLGGRYSEMGGLRWSELEKLDAGILHIKTKTAEGHRRIKSKHGKKKDLTIYLPQVAIDLIKSVPETPGRDCLFGNGRTELTSTGKTPGLLQPSLIKEQLDELIAQIDGAPLPQMEGSLVAP
jgi:integrase